MYCCSIVTCNSKDALDLVLHRIDEYEKLGIVSRYTRMTRVNFLTLWFAVR